MVEQLDRLNFRNCMGKFYQSPIVWNSLLIEAFRIDLHREILTGSHDNTIDRCAKTRISISQEEPNFGSNPNMLPHFCQDMPRR